MADDETTEATSPPEGDRLDRLEETQERQGEVLARIEQALARIVPASHAEAEARTERRLDRGSNLAEEVRAELERAKAEEAAAADAEAEKSEREQLRELAAKLQEKPPAPPRNPLKSLAISGWSDG